ncbi:ankyrin repeat domain-containing protein [Leptospira levettii]|uniref:Ankyrin repeat domain-containing protein n=1 Tax=Leptospira levettii TaxID=2023178 RepID=A0AAW5V9Q8_9LEPT|nr:ankyrin repeat domain-containing protein [Leptospira levettii]MCW7467870.1 ankyrin repeat domain-containing protein [Leptospira levettii]MCW7513486.1 ankyrin repeat domain-containing protein [Leptospira levettii]MCW7517230.1 ankyrin repeat domain-containing protein [Leptospira levettii]
MTKKIPKKKDRPGVDRYGRTPLHNAIINQDYALVDFLINSETNINAQDDDGFTPLHFAAMNLESEIVEKLIKKNAKVDLLDCYNNTPLWRAVFNLKEADMKIIKLFLNAGANPNLKNKNNISPLDFAKKIGNKDLTDLLNNFKQ